MRRLIAWRNLPLAFGALLLAGWVALTVAFGWGWWVGA